MQLWFQALSRLLIPLFLSLDGFFPSDHFENSDFSAAARIVPAPNDLAYQKYDTQTIEKGYPRGVQFYVRTQNPNSGPLQPVSFSEIDVSI